MSTDREPRDEKSSPPASNAEFPDDHTESTRADGIRRVRRVSNWTAAALIVGTGAAAVALGHNAFSANARTVTTVTTTRGAGHGANGPQVTHSVTTTSGSGVTTTNPSGNSAVPQGTKGPQVNNSVTTTSGSGVTTTTTHTANGKTIVKRVVRHSGDDD
ncbi:MAG TPA: hypothetical protein VHC49_08275 [Mycobacteriales bacterium]|nr:hypothetical protein [Mycobacteriales bacterium]